MKKDFVLRFLESVVKKLGDHAVNKEIEKVRKSGPAGKKMAESLDKFNEEYKKVSKGIKPGEYDMMASKEWTDKSLWRLGGN
jgi:CRISPR/Cas system Type II protein with McrA/HNH and RuvC-like nuclease domain